jgi:hypothetical protein
VLQQLLCNAVLQQWLFITPTTEADTPCVPWLVTSPELRDAKQYEQQWSISIAVLRCLHFYLVYSASSSLFFK